MSGVFNAEVEDGKQNSDKYFLESGDKVRFFYEDVKVSNFCLSYLFCLRY